MLRCMCSCVVTMTVGNIASCASIISLFHGIVETSLCAYVFSKHAHFGSVTVPAKKFHIIMNAVKHSSGSAVNVYTEVKFVKDTVRVAQCRLYTFLGVL